MHFCLQLETDIVCFIERSDINVCFIILLISGIIIYHMCITSAVCHFIVEVAKFNKEYSERL